MKNDIPLIGSKWKHKNGNIYKVICIANKDSDRLDEYPITIVYRGENEKIWSRTLDRWYPSMTKIEYDKE